MGLQEFGTLVCVSPCFEDPSTVLQLAAEISGCSFQQCCRYNTGSPSLGIFCLAAPGSLSGIAPALIP